MKNLIALIVLLFCVACSNEVISQGWEDVTPLPYSLKKSNLGGFNGEIIDNGDGYTITSHQNSNCLHVDSSSCRKGLIAYNRNKHDTSKVRKHSFKFSLDYAWLMPEFLIIAQDWVRVLPEHIDPNGNPPITTIKIRSFDGRLFLQHWDNSWQWTHDPSDLDQHLVPGRERMNGEIEITKNHTYWIDLVIQDTEESGVVKVYVDGIMISSAEYRASHLTDPHVMMTGMYWSKGFNLEHDQINILIMTVSYPKYEVMRFDF